MGLALIATGMLAGAMNVSADEVKGYSMYRLYNPNSGEHFYTKDAKEKKGLVDAGWKDEGTGWYAPASGSPVYRLYNKNAGDHHYTLSQKEKDSLIKAGWKAEGIGWYSESDKGTKLYRAYNKNAKAGSHNYTLSSEEQNMLVKAGWKAEGIAWYGMQPGKTAITGTKDVTIDQTTVAFDAKKDVKATDFLGNDVAITVTGIVDTKKAGVYTLTYTAVDGQKQTTTATRKVTVKKVANPMISGVKDTAMDQTVAAFDAQSGITAKDASGKVLDVKVSGTVDTKKVGVYTLTYTATDVFGNATTATRKVTVKKVANPTISGVKDISINKSTGIFDFDKGISAKDASGKALDVTMQTNLTKENPKSGTYTVTYMATDVFGNSTSKNQTVTIVNDIKPVFTGVENAKVNITTGSFDVKSGVQATDGDGNVVAFTVTGAVDFTKSGNNEITYTAKDAAGNETTVKRNVEVFAIAVSSIEISGNTQLHTNEESQLSAMINPTDAWQKDLSWISSNPSIVEVDQTGKIKTLAEGSATVTATAKNGVKQSVEILVSDRIDGYVGSTGYASINGRLTQISFKFSSQDSRTLTVKQATVTGGAFGPITYTQQDYKDKGLPTEIAPYSSLDFSFSNYIGFQQGATTVELLLEASNGTQCTITQGF